MPCANTISCKESFNFKVENSSTAVFNGQKLTPPTISESMLALLPDVLGDSTATGEKRIYVDLTNQKLYAWASPRVSGHTTYTDSKNPGTKVTVFGEAP